MDDAKIPEFIDLDPMAFLKAAPADEDSRDIVARYLAALDEVPDEGEAGEA
jgi:hypothetical protein